MLLPQTKEREYRFKLALRMGLPIFALIIAFISHTLIGNYDTLSPVFYVESLILLVFSIYFILFLIYRGDEVKITDDVTKSFTREYLYKYIDRELKSKSEYTLILISIDNLNDINTLYGIKNGDRVLESMTEWIGSYLKSQKIENFPLGHIKGGDFILGLKGPKSKYITLLELMCLKSSDLKVDDIELKISAAIVDSSYSKEIDYLVENLFEMQEQIRTQKNSTRDENINPNELERFVIAAISKRELSIMTQNVYEDDRLSFKECFIKLKRPDGKLLYPKSYLKVINKLGLMIEYDLMVLEEVLLNAKVDECSLYALNIAPTSLRNEKFLSLTKELLRGSKVKIMFILSEQEYFSHISKYNTIINSLKSLGALFTIDRLGSIHTSFLYLRELHIDVVRFDSYYSNETKLTKYRNIVDGFRVMAEEKGLKTWMKNIQNTQSYRLAKELDIDYLQGKELSLLEEMYEK